MISRRAFIAGVASLAGVGDCGAIEQSPAPRLSRGVNAFPWFSLTREFPAPRTDYDWPPYQQDRPVPTAGDLKRLREVGFDFLRLPVDPGPFLAAAPERRAILLGDLSRAVEMAIGADLAVVLNIEANAATHYWTPERMASGPDAPEFKKYLGFVEDVAKLLARFPARRVALEPINEPVGACDSGGYAAIRLTMLSRARAIAPKLTLIASGGCGSLIQGLDAFDPAPLERLAPILYTFHFYEPYLFTHQGAPWMSDPVYRSLTSVPWPGTEGSLAATLAKVRQTMAADAGVSEAAKAAAYKETREKLRVYFDAKPARAFIDGYLARVDDWRQRHGIANSRMLMGEFGVLRSDARYHGAAAPDRARYISDVRQAAEARGFPWAFWNLFDGMGLMDDRTRAFDAAILESLGLKAARRLGAAL